MRKSFLLTAVAVSAFALPLSASAEIFGEIGLSAGALKFDNTDDTFTAEKVNGLTIDGMVGTTIGASGLGFVDLSYTKRDIGTEVYNQYAPSKFGALGLHLGAKAGSMYMGGFLGVNSFQGNDASTTNGTVDGKLYGLEMENDFGQGTSVFAQMGYATLIGDAGDSGFQGPFAKVGVGHDFGQFSAALSYDYGVSPDIFEDNEDWGEFKGLTLSAEYPINDRLIATAGISSIRYIANTEDDGRETIVSVGLKMPLGGPSAAPKYLRTPTTPGIAAAWGEILD